MGWYGGGKGSGSVIAQCKGNGGRQLCVFGDDRANPLEIYINGRNPTPIQGEITAEGIIYGILIGNVFCSVIRPSFLSVSLMVNAVIPKTVPTIKF